MRHPTPLLIRTALVLVLSGLASSCASPVAPQGFTLAVQLMQVNVAAVDSLRITFAPVVEGAMTAHFVQPTRGMTFENGDITVSVDSTTGLLTMNITGAYFAAHALADTAGNDPRFEIELWSDDRSMHAAPQMRATVTRRGMQIATGVAYLPSWPPALGETSQINVPCMTGFATTCAGM